MPRKLTKDQKDARHFKYRLIITLIAIVTCLVMKAFEIYGPTMKCKDVGIKIVGWFETKHSLADLGLFVAATNMLLDKLINKLKYGVKNAARKVAGKP